MPEPDITAVKDTIREHWNDRAPDFDEGPTHGLLDDDQRAAWTEKVAAWAGPGPVDGLDVGCGTGFFSLLLAGLGHRATGIDVAAAMLERARDKAVAAGLTADFRSADAEMLPFPDASFDLVIERHLIWTLPRPAVALGEWARVLRPNGRLVLVEGHWDGHGTRHADYEAISASLPLYGGRPSGELVALVASVSGAAAFGRIEIEPLTDGVLWGAPPERERYALHARRPARDGSAGGL